jgi:hypothetical protein
MRTPRLPVVDWTDALADLNGLVGFAECRNLVTARVPSLLKRRVPTTKFLIMIFAAPAFCCIHRLRTEWLDSFPFVATGNVTFFFKRRGDEMFVLSCGLTFQLLCWVLQASSYKNSACFSRQVPFSIMKLESRTTEVLSPLSAHAWLHVLLAFWLLIFLFSVISLKTDLEQRNGDKCL